VVETLLGDLHRVVSGVQLGITLTSLAIGALGEATFAKNIPGDLAGQLWNSHHTLYPRHCTRLRVRPPQLAARRDWRTGAQNGQLGPRGACRFAGGFAVPLVPEHFSLGNPFARSDIGCDRKGFGSQFSASSWRGAFNGRIADPIQQARERGLIAPGEEKFILSAMELAQIQVREIMVPRPDIHTLSVEAELDEVMRVLQQRSGRASRLSRKRGPHPRLRSYQGYDLDPTRSRTAPGRKPLSAAVRFAPSFARSAHRAGDQAASELLLELRTRHAGMALVVDEFGSILGLVTMEDILDRWWGDSRRI